ncbi:hypothetical protein [Bacterioplanoides pacificum]|uniref:Uncharacterized protein n=1 Tax=Bacterioplanoides pacificum TaxID=1171596 RepID=A0ABV7VPY8_9GAMM
MTEPITWRTLEISPDIRGATAAFEAGGRNIQSMFDGLKGVGDTLVQNKVDANRRDLQQFLGSFGSPEEYQAALASGAIQERINGYGGYAGDDFMSLAQDGLNTSRERVQADADYQDWTQQRDNRDLRKQIAEADPRTAMDLLETNRDTLGEDFYREQIANRQAQVQGLNAIATENHALSKDRIREHRYGTRFGDDPKAAIKDGTGFTAKQKMEQYQTLSNKPAGSLSKQEQDNLGNLVREMTQNASLEQYKSQVMNDLNAQLQSNAITPAQYATIKSNFEEEFEMFDDTGYLDSADLRADINAAQDLALRTPGTRTGTPIKDNQWYVASEGETLSADAAVSSLLEKVNKNRSDEDKVPAESMMDVVSALFISTQNGMSDGQGNTVTLPMTQGIVDIIASAFEHEEFFGAETNDGPEELARAIAVATNSSDAFADFTDYKADFKQQKQLLRQTNDEVNRLKQAKDAYFKRISKPVQRPAETSEKEQQAAPEVESNVMALAREAQRLREQEQKMKDTLRTEGRNGSVSFSDWRRKKHELEKAESKYEKARDAENKRITREERKARFTAEMLAL